MFVDIRANWQSGSLITLEADIVDNDITSSLMWQLQRSVNYFYNADNELVMRFEVDHAAGTRKTESFYYDTHQIVLIMNSGEVTQRYVWGPNVDQLLVSEQATQVDWPLLDHLNTVRDIAYYNGSSGGIINHRVYDSFGNLVSEGSTNSILFGFTGRYFDIVTSLQYNWNRWYDPRIGQWLSEDPIEFRAGDANLRRMVGNLVLDRVDPTGLEVIVIIAPPPTQPENGDIEIPFPIRIEVLEHQSEFSIAKNYSRGGDDEERTYETARIGTELVATRDNKDKCLFHLKFTYFAKLPFTRAANTGLAGWRLMTEGHDDAVFRVIRNPANTAALTYEERLRLDYLFELKNEMQLGTIKVGENKEGVVNVGLRGVGNRIERVAEKFNYSANALSIDDVKLTLKGEEIPLPRAANGEGQHPKAIACQNLENADNYQI